MALIFLEVLIIFTVSSFEFQQVRLPWIYRYWWVAPIIHLNALDYQVWGNAGVVNTSWIGSQKQFPSM